jgi:putative ABC transport system permease protein
MKFFDYLQLVISSIHFGRLRSVLTGLGITVGITAVVLLTAMGRGLEQYVLAQFTQFGTHVIAVIPGANITMGISGAAINSTRPLSIEDAGALESIPGISTSMPLVSGNSPVEAGNRSRWVNVIGVNHYAPQTWQMKPVLGQFLPEEISDSARNLAVIGPTVRKELFADENPLGQRIRIGQDRFRVIGVMESKGQILGFDLDDTVYIPVTRALSLFNRSGVMEIDLLYAPGQDEAVLSERIKQIIIERHGFEDFTIITQNDMLGVLGSVLGVLTAVVAGLGGISLLVGAVGILTIMSITVRERTQEIGLLRALGASRRQISALFLFEAALLSGVGGVAGLLFGILIAGMMALFIPALPVSLDWYYVLLAEGIAIGTGLFAGLMPARQAARLLPIDALRYE